MTRTAPETRSTNVSGAWTIQAFGAVTNPGSADAAQLASDLAVLQAAFQSDFDFVVLYPGLCIYARHHQREHSIVD